MQKKLASALTEFKWVWRWIQRQLALGMAVFATVPAGWGGSPLSAVRQLTYDGRRSGEGYFSPDGKSLIFQSERDTANPFYQIFILDLESGNSHRVSPGIGKTTCGFFQPDSNRVLFASTHHDPEAATKQKAELAFRASGKKRRYSWDYDEAMDIFSAARDGSNLRQLTAAPGYDAEGAYSPDGTQIVFCSLRDAYPLSALSPAEQKRFDIDPAYFGEIYLMDADGSRPRRLTLHPGYDGGPFFTPDGRRIVWRRFDETGLIADIFTMRTDGSDVRQLTDFQSMAWAPYFHPSGDYVIFTANKFGFENFELFLTDRDGRREPVRITFTDGFDGLPVFSQDGDSLCWTSNRNAHGQSQLYLARWDHAAALQALEAAPLRRQEGAQVAVPVDAERVPLLPPPIAALSPAIQPSDHRAHVSYLASDTLEGRQTGSAGIRAAADYATSLFEQAGLLGIGLPPRYTHAFEFTKRIETAGEGNWLRAESKGQAAFEKAFEVGQDFRPLPFTGNGEFSGRLVFAGYGLSVPGELGEGYNSYAGLNVSNKIVLALRYVPEDVSLERRQVLNRYAGLRYKAMIAREHGAGGILIVTGPNSPNAGELIRHSFDSSLAGSDILAASISGETANHLLSPAHRDLKTLQTALDRENPHAEGGFEIPGITVALGARVKSVKGKDDNIAAFLPPGSAEAANEYVIVGAHYDHLGRGRTSSLQRKGEKDAIHNGADDNASGVSLVLELAASLAARQEAEPADFRRGVLFALWSGEEIGLIGSSNFAEEHAPALGRAVAYLNFDMIGRLKENRLVLQGVGSSTAWPRLIERKNVSAGFSLVLQDDPYLPTDATVFYSREIPILNFFTGSHEDYHRPSDTADKLNYDGLARISRFAEQLVLELVHQDQTPDYVKVERTKNSGGSREATRAYLGTIPDYATEVQGVKLSGVSGGGPADRAGLQGGDIIMRFAGRKIANIYDYTYAIDAVKIGKPVKIVIQRKGKTIELEIIPEARK